MKQSIFQIQDEIRALEDTRVFVEGQILRKRIALDVLFESLQIRGDAAATVPLSSPVGSVTNCVLPPLESMSVPAGIKRVLPELNCNFKDNQLSYLETFAMNETCYSEGYVNGLRQKLRQAQSTIEILTNANAGLTARLAALSALVPGALPPAASLLPPQSPPGPEAPAHIAAVVPGSTSV